MAWCFIDLVLLERRLNTRGLFLPLISSYIFFLQQAANNSPTRRLLGTPSSSPWRRLYCVAVWDFGTHIFLNLAFSLHVKEFECGIREKYTCCQQSPCSYRDITNFQKPRKYHELPMCAHILDVGKEGFNHCLFC